MTDDLARMRLDYETAGIDVDDLLDDPVAQFEAWFADAVRAELVEPNAMVVSTVDAEGQPWSRHVLLKGTTEAAFDFYTNYESDKSQDLEVRPVMAATFGWLGLHRQVSLAGTVEKVPAAESDAYWAVRARGSQLGGWASPQSRVLADRGELERSYAEVEARFADADEVPRPPHWGGWRLTPHTVDFWQGRRNRLHDRVRYQRDETSGSWSRQRLAP